MLTHNHSDTVPSRVVVLGSRGFVGADLLATLSRSGVPALGVSSQDIDLTAPASAQAVAGLLRADDTVVFVSALTPDKGRDIATLMRNLTMGQHVCQALAERPCAHVIYVSSDAVYDDLANPVREGSNASAGSFHATMHLARERMLIETLRPSRVPLALLRASLLYGPGDTHNGYGPNRFVRTALAERRIALFGDGEERRDHVFISDVSRLIELAARRGSSGVLNVATGVSCSFREVAEAVAVLVGGVEIVPSPRANPVTHRHFDVTAIAAAFPTFAFTPLEAGLRRALTSDAV